MLAHNVFFTLNDDSPAAQQKLVESCRQHLSDHPNITCLRVGALVPDLDRPVNVRDFHVGLHIIFKDRASHDAYQASQQHLRFIEENQPSWKQVRIFDSSDDLL